MTLRSPQADVRPLSVTEIVRTGRDMRPVVEPSVRMVEEVPLSQVDQDEIDRLEECRLIREDLPRPVFHDLPEWRRILERHKATGIPMVVVEFLQQWREQWHPDPGMQKWATGHVALELPDGRYHDGRGMWDCRWEMVGDMHPDLTRRVRPVGMPELTKTIAAYEAAIEAGVETDAAPEAASVALAA